MQIDKSIGSLKRNSHLTSGNFEEKSNLKVSRCQKDQQINLLTERVLYLQIDFQLNKLSSSIDFSILQKNRLNLIQYQMEGERNRNDSVMILTKLRKLQNRAQIYRAQNQLSLIQRQHKENIKNRLTHRKRERSEIKKEDTNKPYLKIYQAYLKEKEIEESKFYDEDDQNSQLKEYLQNQETKNGIKYISLLKKHPKLFNYTVYKKKKNQGIIKLELQSQRKSSFSKKMKQTNNFEQYEQQKKIQDYKQQGKYIQNPQKVIERQMTKFYLKKNTGKLSDQAKLNERSLELMNKQKQISFEIEDENISKGNRKKMKQRFNEMVNQIAKSDRRKSLEGLLPKLKQIQSARKSQSRQMHNSLKSSQRSIQKVLFVDQ